MATLSTRVIDVCPQCGTPFHESGNFCAVCGAAMAPASPQQQQTPVPDAVPVSGDNHHHAVARGFTQTFGLHPAIALLTVVVNAMIFGDTVFSTVAAPWTAGLSLVQLTAVSTFCGGILGIITYRAQKKWYGDDKESSLIKALIVGFITAIPAGLPGFLAAPAGIIGLFNRKKP